MRQQPTADVRFYDELDNVPMPLPRTIDAGTADVAGSMLPLVERYFREHSYTVLDEIDLSTIALRAMDRAEIEVRIKAQSTRQSLTQSQHAELVNQLAWELLVDAAARGEVERMVLFDMEQRDQRHDELMAGLVDIKHAVDRSAVAANAIDTAMEHPFLLGFFGRGFVNSIVNSFSK